MTPTDQTEKSVQPSTEALRVREFVACALLVFLALAVLPPLLGGVCGFIGIIVAFFLSDMSGVDLFPTFGYATLFLGVALFILNARLALRGSSVISFVGGALLFAGLTIGEFHPEDPRFQAAPSPFDFPQFIPTWIVWFLEIETYDFIFGIARGFVRIAKRLFAR